jgi:hypothetical protein
LDPKKLFVTPGVNSKWINLKMLFVIHHVNLKIVRFMLLNLDWEVDSSKNKAHADNDSSTNYICYISSHVTPRGKQYRRSKFNGETIFLLIYI